MSTGTTTDRAVETETVVSTAVGDLGAIVRVPGVATPLPGVVLVDGSGDGDRHDWGGWPQWLGDAGSVVLRHDKPGCGGAPRPSAGQTRGGRAQGNPSPGRGPGARGGWLALLAAAMDPGSVDFVICHSGPGTTPAQQERERQESWLRAGGHDEQAVAEALAWVDTRADLLRRGVAPAEVLARQAQFADRAWADVVLPVYDSPENLRFVSGLLDFDPTAVMPQVSCPVLALFGAADSVIPVPVSVAAFATHLPPHPGHGVAVFPGADHGLFVADPDPQVPRRDQLAPAYLPTLMAFLADRRVA